MTTVPIKATNRQSVTFTAGILHWPRLLTKIILKRMDDDGMFQQAAALAYSTLFSLLPTFVIALLVTSLIGGSGHQFQNFVLKQLGLNEIQIISTDKVTTDKTTTDLATYVMAQLESVRKIVQSPQSGIIGFVTLLWGAISLMLAIERAFSRVYRVKKERPLYRRLILYWSVLTLGPLGVAASLWLTHIFQNAAADVSVVHAMLRPLGLIAGYLVSFTLLTIMYKLIPDTFVRTSSALIGGFVGAVLWEGGKYLFGLYVTHFVGYGKWYGTLGLVPLFMFWIYLTWNFVLLGLEVSYIHQHFAILARRIARCAESETTMTDLHWVLAVGAMLAENFAVGKSLDPDEVAEELHIPLDVADNLLRGLEKAGIAHSIAGADKSYALSRPPENITAAELLASARTSCQTPSETTFSTPNGPRPIQTSIAQLQKIEADWATTHTLRDMITNIS